MTGRGRTSTKHPPNAAITGAAARGEKPKQSEKKLPAQHGNGTRRKCVDPKEPAGPYSKPLSAVEPKRPAVPRAKSERPVVPRTKSPSQESDRHDKKGSRKKDDPGRVLLRTLEKLKIKKDAKSEASRIKNEIVDKIKTHLDKSRNFYGMKTLPTGSYFENLKVFVDTQVIRYVTVNVLLSISINIKHIGTSVSEF